MIVGADAEQWSTLWDAYENESQCSTEKGLAIIFSVHEVETVCAVKMLQVALRTKGVQFSQYPVETEVQLQRTLEQLLSGSVELRTVLLLNCGASLYIKDLMPSSCLNTRFIVVDSHRPINPRYNDGTDLDALLVLAADDPCQQADIPPASDLDFMTEQQREELLELASQEQEEEEEQADVQDSPAKRQRREGAAGGRTFRTQLRLLRERDQQLRNYYEMGSSYGKPTPLVLQPLAEHLMAARDNTILWPAAVGLTDQWVHQRLSSRHYTQWHAQLRLDIEAADTNFMAQQQQQQRHGRNSDRLSDSGSGKQPVSQPRLVAVQDYRLMLFRHWTLYDAVCCSPYVAPRLQTWRPGGKEAVSLLFANMGVSMEQAKTDYGSMQGRFRELFNSQLEAALQKTSLSINELRGETFQLHHSLKVTSASDMVHACTALLSEYCVSDVQDQGSAAQRFWNALDALDCYTQHGWQMLRKGVADAKVLQQAIIMDGGNMVTDQKLKVTPSARLQELNLATLAPTNADEFRHPLTLLRLAHFVRDATKIARQGGGLRTYNYPIMVIGPEDAAGWCIVIGLRSNMLATEAQYNVFGRTFQAVLESEDSEVQWDTTRRAFDASVVYIHRDSLVTFCSDVRAHLISSAADAAAAASKEQQQQQQQQQPGGEGGGDATGVHDTQQQQQQPGGSKGRSSSSSQPDRGKGLAQEGGTDELTEVESLADTLEGSDAGEGLEDVDVVAASDDEGGAEAE